MQGQQDPPLNEKGRMQARLAADFVRSEFAPTNAWSSDLRRCVETAAPLELPTTTSRKLREIYYGRWEGLRFEDLSPADQEHATGRLAGTPDFRAPGGESLRELVRRGEAFLAESKVLDAEGDVVIVGHGGALRCLLVALLALPDEALNRFQFSNCGVSVVTADDGHASLAAFNITGHLNHARPMH